MDANAQSQMFFFISSIGFVFLWILLGIFLFYLIRATYAFSRILEKIEKDINEIGDTTKELFHELKENILYKLLNLFFKKKKRSKAKE